MRQKKGVGGLGWFLAGLLAAAISWVVNSWITERGGRLGLTVLVPLVEETAKTGLAVMIGGELVLVHAVFGSMEAIYETCREQQLGPAIAAFVSHLLFGLVTLSIYRYFNNWGAAILGGTSLHALWNLLIIHLFLKPPVGGKES
ncbi:MAG: hypothetical protein ACOX5W_11730 [Bacillota bacterium]